MLRAQGSTVAPSLPAISPQHAADNIAKLHRLCGDYIAAVVLQKPRAPPPLSYEGLRIVFLPLLMPPVMLQRHNGVHQKLLRSLERKRHSIVATYGYCMTPETSVAAMTAHRIATNHLLDEADGGSFRRSLSKTATDLHQSLKVRLGNAAEVEVKVAREAVAFPDTTFDDNATLWSDCLHFTAEGYNRMGSQVAKAILKEL